MTRSTQNNQTPNATTKTNGGQALLCLTMPAAIHNNPKELCFLFAAGERHFHLEYKEWLILLSSTPDIRPIIRFSGTDKGYIYNASLNLIRFSITFGTVQLHSNGAGI